MAEPHRTDEIRCPVHGFIPINDWEREIINQPAFLRLRRIRQLAWTDHVYPGATHTRFEHSLGVMHIATQLYDCIVQRSGQILKEFYAYDEAGLKRDRMLVRLAALLTVRANPNHPTVGETTLVQPPTIKAVPPARESRLLSERA